MLRTLLCLATVTVLVVGCSSSSTNPTNPNDDKTNGNNQFQVDGAGYSGGYWRGLKDESAHIAYTSTAGGTGNFAFNGLTTTADETFTVGLLTSKPDKGTYTVNAAAGNSMTLVFGNPKRTFLAVSGTIEIDQFDAVGGRAKGNFSGSFVEASMAATTLTVSNGKFDIPVLAEP